MSDELPLVCEFSKTGYMGRNNSSEAKTLFIAMFWKDSDMELENLTKPTKCSEYGLNNVSVQSFIW